MTKSTPEFLAATLLACTLLMPLLAAGAAQSVPSESQVRGTIRSADGKAAYDEQMNGTPLRDGFGTRLPPGVSAGDIVKVLLPGADAALATLVGMKRWPYAQDSYIAIACIAPDKATGASTLANNGGKPVCSPWPGGMRPEEAPKGVALTTIAIGVVQMRRHDPLVSSTVVRWAGADKNPLSANWHDSHLECPALNPDDTSGGTGPQQPTYPTDLDRFDFAKYRISDTTTAFGVRSGWWEGYAGGGATFRALTLFAVIDGELRAVFSEPVYCMQDVAGDWHDDGTRDHTVYESENLIVVSDTMTDGYFNLIVKSKTKPWRREFRWDKQRRRYVSSK